MPRFEIAWCTLLLAAFALFAVTYLLRFSCSLANSVGQWSPQCELIRVPKYRTCFTIVIAAGVVLGLVTSLIGATSPVWSPGLLNERSLHFLTITAQWLGFASVIGVGLSENQRRSTSLVFLAAILHAGLLLLLVFWLPKFMAVGYWR